MRHAFRPSSWSDLILISYPLVFALGVACGHSSERCGLHYTHRQRETLQQGKVVSFVPKSTGISVYVKRVVLCLPILMCLCYNACCQVFVCKRRENHHVLLGLLSASSVMLTDFVILQ